MNGNYFSINGLSGERKLSGKIIVNGAKNAVIKVIASSILFSDDLVIENVPIIEDVKKSIEILKALGANVILDEKENRITINTQNINSFELPDLLSRDMRASVTFTGPMLARFGKVVFPYPGGCVIGVRPIDQLLKAYKAMGIKVEESGDVFTLTAPKDKSGKYRLSGAEIFFDMQTVGGTETAMLASVFCSGKTVLKNCAMEPEIVSIGELLQKAGARIVGLGTPTIEIYGVRELNLGGEKYHTIPDRIEAGSFLLLAGLLAKDVTIEKCNPEHMEAVISLLKESGVHMEIGEESIRVIGEKCEKKLRPFNIKTHEYPGFPTDLQSPAVTYLALANGGEKESIVFETIYESRFKFVEDLKKLGADITPMNPREILIRGVDGLAVPQENCNLNAHDIRAGFAVVMASLFSNGRSELKDIKYIDRGYEKLEERLSALGADIKRV